MYKLECEQGWRRVSSLTVLVFTMINVSVPSDGAVPLPPENICVDGACNISLASKVFTIEVKSFINTIDLTDNSQFSEDLNCWQAIGQRTTAAMAMMGTCLPENPKDGTLDTRNFRLRSSVSFEATCRESGPRITITKFQSDLGSEFLGLMTATGGFEIEPAITMIGKEAQIHFVMAGQPAEDANTALNTVKNRSCTYIWHDVTVRTTCENGSPSVIASLVGSAFPSHRLWINGSQSKDLPQGKYSALWRCDVDKPTHVAGP